MAAEYVLKEGNPDVILCERGIRTFETGYRFTLDLMAVPVLKELTHLPVVVDPSHAAGKRALVEPLSWPPPPRAPTGSSSRSTPCPEAAICDGPQALYADEFAEYLRQLEAAAALAGKSCGSQYDAGRRPRRRADRRLDRARRRASMSTAPRSWATAATGGAGARPRARRRRPRRGSLAEARRGRRRLLRLRAGRRAAGAGGRGARRRAGPDCVVTRRRLDQARLLAASTTRASSAATRSPAPRRPAWSTRAPTSSRARPGT